MSDESDHGRAELEQEERAEVHSFGGDIVRVLLLIGLSVVAMLWIGGAPRVPALSEQTRERDERVRLKEEERREFRSYVWGIGLALLLTAPPFALVHWFPGIPRFSLFLVIGAFGLAQMLVHFRFFLHIGFRENREDLQLLLFSALLLIIMVAGTVWVMASLAQRMTMAGSF